MSLNKEKAIMLLGLLIIVLLLIIQQIAISRQQKDSITNNKELKEYIDNLNNKIDSINDIRDSLIIVVDTTKIKIVTLEKKYETIRDSIISQSVDSDCITFAGYISKYNNRLSDSNNSKSTQDK